MEGGYKRIIMQKILCIMLAIQLSSMLGAAQEDEVFSGLVQTLESAFGSGVLLILPDQGATNDEDEEDRWVNEVTASPAVESTASSAIEPVSHAAIQGNDVSFYEYFTSSGTYNAETILDRKGIAQEERHVDGFQEVGEGKKTDALGEEIQNKLSLIINKTRRSTNPGMTTIRSEHLSSQEFDILMLLEERSETSISSHHGAYFQQPNFGGDSIAKMSTR